MTSRPFIAGALIVTALASGQAFRAEVDLHRVKYQRDVLQVDLGHAVNLLRARPTPFPGLCDVPPRDLVPRGRAA